MGWELCFRENGVEAECQWTAGEEAGEGTWLGNVTMAVGKLMAAWDGMRGWQQKGVGWMWELGKRYDGLCADTEKLMRKTVSLWVKARVTTVAKGTLCDHFRSPIPLCPHLPPLFCSSADTLSSLPPHPWCCLCWLSPGYPWTALSLLAMEKHSWASLYTQAPPYPQLLLTSLHLSFLCNTHYWPHTHTHTHTVYCLSPPTSFQIRSFVCSLLHPLHLAQNSCSVNIDITH